MKIWLFSDTHLPHDRYPIESVFPAIPQADVCVCAGDLIESDPVAGIHWLARYIQPWMPTVYVLGNHEFYNAESNMERLRHQARVAAKDTGIHLLDDEAVTIDGIRILGTTLWSDFSIFARGDLGERDRAMAETGRALNDFRLIKADETNSGLWTPRSALLQHFQSRFWLDASLAEAELLQVVVVSHHAPHPLSISRQFVTDLVTAGFVSDLTDLILRRQPALWLHGHTHTSFDYSVGPTRVRCNPRGYRHEKVLGYDPGLIITL